MCCVNEAIEEGPAEDEGGRGEAGESQGGTCHQRKREVREDGQEEDAHRRECRSVDDKDVDAKFYATTSGFGRASTVIIIYDRIYFDSRRPRRRDGQFVGGPQNWNRFPHYEGEEGGQEEDASGCRRLDRDASLIKTCKHVRTYLRSLMHVTIDYLFARHSSDSNSGPFERNERSGSYECGRLN